jgi:hypothetical protein
VRIVFIALQWVGIVFIAHALMLIGADEITTLERGRILTVRSLQQILTLYGADPMPWLSGLAPAVGGVSAVVLGWPAWAILAGIGGMIWVICRHLEST